MKKGMINITISMIAFFCSSFLVKPTYAYIIIDNNHFTNLQPGQNAEFNFGDPIQIFGTEYISIQFVNHDGTSKEIGNMLNATSDFGFSFSKENIQMVSGFTSFMPDALPIVVNSGFFTPSVGIHSITWTMGFGIANSPIAWTTSKFTQNFIVHNVPEPNNLLLLSTGLLGLIGLGRKSQNS